MRKLALIIALLSLLAGSALAQGGPFASPSVQFGIFPAATTFVTGLRVLPFGSYGTGSLEVFYSGITGAPSGCSYKLAFSGSNEVTLTFGASIFASPANGREVLRVTNSTPNIWPNVAINYTCTTYPTTGTIAIEFTPDSQAQAPYNYSHIATNTSTVISTVPKFLHTVNIGTAGSSETVTLFDNTTCSGATIAVITPTVTSPVYIFDISTTVGLCVLTAGTTAGDYTVTYR